ncbi:hydrogenase nickel incorporation protein HypB [Xenorhabdus bovienii]|uniref:hydrogenase nickel incorporation protein HypB n=1 Tax=Xenorhabdus bovienii TaxID=40576 RepID=UPI0023B29337|nr:hydrogenase nickel incorporation protein HypB [Xenorhabdus bovienii]MDE9534392.1 hydrogenase nickel incorporation protein HypB [Xenorhabdus bovienii]MDE9586602.1 hydrogenase nickel incorporation protein HypB [Xenorhabdus bovienii]
MSIYGYGERGEPAHSYPEQGSDSQNGDYAAVADKKPRQFHADIPQNSSQPIIIHHHYYHHNGDVHHHYHGNEQMPEFDMPVSDRCQKQMLQVELDVLSQNNHIAECNRRYFTLHHILALNLISSPGSGKTTLLMATLNRLRNKVACAAIEGDQQTSHDADRIRAVGIQAVQVNTGKGCYLDAEMVREATRQLKPAEHSLLFIENVGNLVCPASFDLGEQHKIVMLSVTEGEDKPLKYPMMFAEAELMIINKVDLLPYLNIELEACIQAARCINPDIDVIALSASTGEGIDQWLSWLEARLSA